MSDKTKIAWCVMTKYKPGMEIDSKYADTHPDRCACIVRSVIAGRRFPCGRELLDGVRCLMHGIVKIKVSEK